MANDSGKLTEMEQQARDYLGMDELFVAQMAENLQSKGITPNLNAPLPPIEGNDFPTHHLPYSESPSNYEEAILALSGVRDDLVQAWTQLNANPKAGGIVLQSIRNVEQSITKLGGAVDPFNELKQKSGLSQEKSIDEDQEKAMLSNALKTAQNTRENYALYEISNMMVRLIKGRPGILVQLKGKDASKDFIVNGQVVAKTDFDGNEAIDYVRADGRDMLSVKAVQLGKWVDVSDRFEIRSVDVSPKTEA